MLLLLLLSSSSSSSSSLLEWKVERRTSRTVESPLRKPARLNPPDLFKSSVCVCVCVCRSQRRRWLLHQIGFGSSVIFTPRAPIKGSRRRLCRRLRPTRPSTHSAHLALRERRWGWEGGGVWKRLSKLNLPPQRPPFSRDAWQKHTHRPVPFQPLTRKPSGAASLALSLSLSLHLPLCSLLSFWGLAGFFFWLLLLCLSLSLSGTSRPAALIVARCII